MENLKKLCLGALFVGALVANGTASAQQCALSLNGECVDDVAILDNWNYNSATGELAISTQNVVEITATNTPTPTNPQVTISSFLVNSRTSATVDEGTSVTLSWSVSNATSCSYIGGNASWRNATWSPNVNRRTIVVDHIGQLTYTLSCQGEGGPVQRGVRITGQEVQEAPPADSGTCTKNTQARQIFDWGDYFKADFPGPRYDTDVYVTAREGGGTALRMETGNFVGSGTIGNVLEAIGEPSIQKYAISPCPGDWDVPQDCQVVSNFSSAIKWSTEGQAGACQLLPNTVYYLNLGWTGECDRCLFRLQAVNRDY
jgi:hypothetical protein